MVSTPTIVSASVATIATGLVAYAVYFDHQRRSRPEFRRNLRREERRSARMAEVLAAEESDKQVQQIKKMVDDAKAEGFPEDTEEKESYFLEQVSLGEQLSSEPTRMVEAALAFYRGIKVYPNPNDLISIYDKTVPKPVLDIIAIMIAYDPTLKITGTSQKSSTDLPPVVGLD